jgi:hypothetical protein
VLARNAEEWARIRARGKPRFLLLRGVLTRGVPMALVCAIGIEIYLGNALPETMGSPAFLGRLALALIFFSLGGVLNAQMYWRLNERRFGGQAGGSVDPSSR